MYKFSVILILSFVLVGCSMPKMPDTTGIKEAGQDIVEGKNMLVDGSRSIISEGQKIIEEIRPTKPETGESIWLRLDSEACGEADNCFSWRPDETVAWQRFEGQIENLDSFVTDFENVRVVLSKIESEAASWNIDSLLDKEPAP